MKIINNFITNEESNFLLYYHIQNFNLTDPICADKEIKPIINVTLQAYDAPLNAPPGTSQIALNGEDTQT